MNASKMTSTDASESYIQDNLATAGTKITWSFFAKKGDLDYAHGLIWDLSANGCRQWFNLSTGAVGGTTTFGSGYSVDSATIEDYGNGWYRCAMVVNSTAGTQGCRVNISSADTTIGSAVNSYGYFYGIQLEDASYPTSYIPTYGASVTRNAEANVGSFNGDEIFSDSYTAMVDLVIPHQGTTGTGAGWGARVVEGSTSLNNWSWVLVHQSSTQLDLNTKTSGGGSNSNLINYTWGDRIKMIVRSDGYYFVNGTKYILSGSGLQSAEPVEIGFGRIGNSAFSSGESTEVNQALVFPTALTDSECIALTTI
jgi:hypothetical protein